ncbi:hypothetical protein DPMN_057272 [Dreissena polymorpha]|uniref:Uncharacterized protein n=1 Tax=Dreissena polymorpha TaxID=45954 RepID=A0A9D4CUY9_DREPO|nr:hypothetical protein DPMN_057272 [Dreissena polymorpha]
MESCSEGFAGAISVLTNAYTTSSYHEDLEIQILLDQAEKVVLFHSYGRNDADASF